MGFYGNVLAVLTAENLNKDKILRICREKQKVGVVEKILDNYTILIKDLFKKESNINIFIDKPVILKNTNNFGKIESSFGKSGKVKAHFDKGVYFIN